MLQPRAAPEREKKDKTNNKLKELDICLGLNPFCRGAP